LAEFILAVQEKNQSWREQILAVEENLWRIFADF